MEHVAQKISWINRKPRGKVLAKNLSQPSTDGLLTALFEIFTACGLSHFSGANLGWSFAVLTLRAATGGGGYRFFREPV
jgi:hypothetical protein